MGDFPSVQKDENFVVHILKLETADQKCDIIGCFLDEDLNDAALQKILKIRPSFLDKKSFLAWKALQVKKTLQDSGLDMSILTLAIKFGNLWTKGMSFIQAMRKSINYVNDF